MIRARTQRLCALLTWLLLSPAMLLAQEEAAEELPPPPDVAEAAGEWWARLVDADFQSEVFAALTNIAAIIILSGIIYFVAMALLNRTIRRVDRDTAESVQPARRRKQRVGTVLELIRSVVSWVILITAGVWILASAGMDIRPLLAGAGVLGLAIGFGAQNLVKDVVSGFFILIEGQYAVGDYVQVGANFGMVESVGMRVTVLKDLDNQRHFVPNGAIMQVTVYEQPFINYVVELPIADAEQCDEARCIVADIVARLQEEYQHYLVYHEPPIAILWDRGGLVRIPLAIFPTQDWLVNEVIPADLKDALAAAEIPLREGQAIRAYFDLSRMPTYHHADGEIV